jgi:hypothetical protein
MDDAFSKKQGKAAGSDDFSQIVLVEFFKRVSKDLNSLKVIC